MDRIKKRYDCIRFRYAELTRKKIDGEFFYVLFMDGDYFYHRTYSAIMTIS